MTVHSTCLPHDDVVYGGMRWFTLGPADQLGTSISGHPVRL
jgi:hypothetical protein